MHKIDKLKDMYNKVSKHSGYQVIASPLLELVSDKDIKVTSRSERERFEYIQKIVDLTGKKVADVGGNTGFFSFESVNAGAKKVSYIEGNRDHAEFVSLASEVIGFSDRIEISNEYFKFNNSDVIFDVMFILNVLHHVGDDYGNKDLSINFAKKEIINSLKNIASQTKILIFQIGYNWKGDVTLPLFENGTKNEQIDFLVSSLGDFYDIMSIGIAEKNEKNVVYHEKNENNVAKFDSYGEFLNRPLFVMRSKKCII
jgi:SAM-dependent methyltransferase